MRRLLGYLCICAITVLPAYAGQQAAHSPNDIDAQENVTPLIGFWTIIGTQGTSNSPPVQKFHKHDASGTCMPMEVGTFAFSHQREYAPGDESVTLWSEKMQTQVTLYTFPAAEPAEEEFEAALTETQRACNGPGASTSIGDLRFEQPGQIGGCTRPQRRNLICSKLPGPGGIMEVASGNYPDPTAFDPKDKHYDRKSHPDNPRWYLVDVKFVRKLNRTIPLSELKEYAELSELPLVRKGNRPSIMPVTEEQWAFILGLA